jgi:hypothetical protein
VKSFTVTTTVKIDPADVAGLLSCAFEGGSGYWCAIDGYEDPPEPRAVFDAHLEEPQIFKYLDYPLQEGGAVIVLDCCEDERHRLDLAAVRLGLQRLAQHPRHWADFKQENYDAITGDVFLQLCLLGEIRYG